MKFSLLKIFITCIFMMFAGFSNAGLIAINDGTVNFNANDYTNGYGLLGEANFIDINYINNLNQLGDDVIIKLSMGIYTDYYKPADGVNMGEMLTSWNKHTWSSDLVSFITPVYLSSNHLGGISVGGYESGNINGDSLNYLSF